jgi:uncharacterized protein (TIGR02246 family)
MVRAWDAGDAAAYARQFTEDATYVIFAGAVSHGREAIRRDHELVLGKFQKGSRMRVKITQIRYLDDDTAYVLTEGGVSKRTRIALNKVQSFLFRRQVDGSWLCEAFQNTKKNQLMIWLASRGAQQDQGETRRAAQAGGPR